MLVGSDVERSDFFISESLFGANFLANRDRFGHGTFDEKVMELKIQALRYPGGSLTEELFDLRQPNRTSAVDRNGVTHEIVALTDFLSYASEAGLAATIVIPTRTALSFGPIGTRDVSPEAIADLKEFAFDVLTGKYGETPIHAFEIGNEYWGSGEMNSVEYGRVASAFALALQEVITLVEQTTSASQEVKIAVQIGQNGLFDRSATSFILNQTVMKEFNREEAAAVDAVVAHFYTDDRPVDFIRNDSRFNRLQAWEQDPRFGELDLFVTEWNVQSPNSTEMGLKQAPALLAMFSELVFQGVDSAWVWPVQQNNKTSLSGNEGDTNLTIAGETFKILSGTLIGSFALGRTINERSGTYSFVKDDQLIVYVASHSETVTSHFLDLARWSSDIRGINALLLTTDGRVDDHQAKPLLEIPDFSHLGSKIEFDLNPYEVVQFTVTIGDVGRHMPVGVRKGTSDGDVIDGTNLREDISGFAGNDTIRAAGGNDTVSGGGGADWVDLGAGNDLYRAETPTADRTGDTVFGGDGNDMIILGGGNDIINAGGGNDTVSGNFGDDIINGNHGRDRLQGNTGHDTINGGIARDTLIGGFGDDVLNGDNGSDTLRGGAGRDTLNGGDGNDLLIGGLGADTFVFSTSFGGDRVRDFTKVDRLDFTDLDLTRNEVDGIIRNAVRQTDGVLLSLGWSGTVLLEGVQLGEINIGDVIW